MTQDGEAQLKIARGWLQVDKNQAGEAQLKTARGWLQVERSASHIWTVHDIDVEGRSHGIVSNECEAYEV